MLVFSGFLSICWLHEHHSNDLQHAMNWAASVQPGEKKLVQAYDI